MEKVRQALRLLELAQCHLQQAQIAGTPGDYVQDVNAELTYLADNLRFEVLGEPAPCGQ